MSEEELYHEQLYQEYLKEEEYKEEYQKECSYIEYLEKQLKECKEFATTFERELSAIIKFKGIEITKLQQQLKDKDEKISKIEKLTKQLKGSARYERCIDELDYILNIIKED